MMWPKPINGLCMVFLPEVSNFFKGSSITILNVEEENDDTIKLTTSPNAETQDVVDRHYTELQITSNFTFLRGASHPEELVEQAIALGYQRIAITDRNSFAGIVRAHAAAKKGGISIVVGCRLDLKDGISLLAYPTNGKAYAQLCNLLSVGNLRAEKGKCF